MKILHGEPYSLGHNSIIPFAGIETSGTRPRRVPLLTGHNSIIPFAGMET